MFRYFSENRTTIAVVYCKETIHYLLLSGMVFPIPCLLVDAFMKTIYKPIAGQIWTFHTNIDMRPYLKYDISELPIYYVMDLKYTTHIL